MRHYLMGGALALALAGVAGAQSMDHSKMSHGRADLAPAGPALPTPDYLTAAGQSDQFEVQEGQLAQSMGKSPGVKNFGKMMVTEHTKTTANLMAAVKASGMSPPPPPPLRADQQAMIDQLKQTSGDEFDRTYISQQLSSHQEALSVQSGYANGGSEPKIKATAKQTVPIVQSHIRQLQSMQTKMGG